MTKYFAVGCLLLSLSVVGCMVPAQRPGDPAQAQQKPSSAAGLMWNRQPQPVPPAGQPQEQPH